MLRRIKVYLLVTNRLSLVSSCIISPHHHGVSINNMVPYAMAALRWGIRRLIKSEAIFTPVSETETDANISPSQGMRLNWFHSLSLSKFHLEGIFKPRIIPPWGPAGDYWLSKCTVLIFVTASTFSHCHFRTRNIHFQDWNATLILMKSVSLTQTHVLDYHQGFLK